MQNSARTLISNMSTFIPKICSRTTDENHIQVYLPYTTRSDKWAPALPIDEHTTVEDVLIKCCRRLNIEPTARYLYGLRRKSKKPKIWLNMSYRLADDRSTRKYVLAIRFHPADPDRLARTKNSAALDFYYRQTRHHLLNAKASGTDAGKINRLCVDDMYRSLKEDSPPVTEAYIKRHLRHYFPKQAYMSHRWLFKASIRKAFDKMVKEGREDLQPIKLNYLRAVRHIFPDYLAEEYVAYVKEDGGDRRVVLRVNPFDAVYPGISIHNGDGKVRPERRLSFDDLCYINIRDDEDETTVEMSTKNADKWKLNFYDRLTVKSFVSLLDGYYRLMVNWTFNLCPAYETPSLKKLLEHKCHGPVETNFAHEKLKNEGKSVPGFFILRESRDSFDEYLVDVFAEERPEPFTYKIEKKNDGNYVLDNEDESYKSLSELVYGHRLSACRIPLVRCVPPFEYDQSDLLMCNVKLGANVKNQAEMDEQKRRNVVEVVQADSLSITPDCLPDEDHKYAYTTVQRVRWHKYNERELVIKRLNKGIGDEYLEDFLSLANGWDRVKTDSVVRMCAIQLYPVSMIMEYMPKDRLDAYLMNADNRLRIKKINLLQASVSLAEALYYLEKIGYVHGYIRCKKLFVYTHTDTSLDVKLAEPSLGRKYEDFDLHWIPPEHHDKTNDAKTSTEADVWAFATTLWEIFNYGRPPGPDEILDHSSVKEFYESDQINRPSLPIPPGCRNWSADLAISVYKLMQDCWNPDKDLRKKPQTILRDINWILLRSGNDNKQPDGNVTDDAESSNDDPYPYIPFSPATEYEQIPLDRLNQLHSTPFDTRSIQNGLETLLHPTPFDTRSIQNGLETLIFIEPIGVGNFGEVFKGARTNPLEGVKKQPVAIKIFHAGKTNIGDFKKEVQIMSGLNHPNVIKIISYTEAPETLLVTEYAPLSSLEKCLGTHRKSLTLINLLLIAADIASGMSYLNGKKIVHRDLAARNILMMSNNPWTAKICDFGLARFIGNKDYYTSQSNGEIPILWYAPESLTMYKFTTKSDVWSYGVTLFEMFSYGARPAFPNVRLTFEDQEKALKSGMRLECPSGCPSWIYNELVTPCWKYDPSERLTFDELRNQILIKK